MRFSGKGVRQGGHSPHICLTHLFNVFMDGLSERVNATAQCLLPSSLVTDNLTNDADHNVFR